MFLKNNRRLRPNLNLNVTVAYNFVDHSEKSVWFFYFLSMDGLERMLDAISPLRGRTASKGTRSIYKSSLFQGNYNYGTYS